MSRSLALSISLVLAPPLPPQDGVGAARQRLLDAQRKAEATVESALARLEAGDPAGLSASLRDAVSAIDALMAVVPADLTPAERTGLERAAATLRREVIGAADPSPQSALREASEVLARVGRRLQPKPALDLAFQGSYTETKVAEPAYGGHASAMGPAPAQITSRQDARDASPVRFQERSVLPVKTYCGGPTKEHILESGGSGVALLDYDGDGRLDVYLVNAYQLSADRRRIPHRNALYRNLGGWRFEDVSRRAGVDAAAWGNGVCVGDADDDGRLDLYVTNFGPNLLYRNNGDGTFADVAERTGVRASGWSTGCAFFDADGDGDLDLYVARYVATTWDEVVKARRTHTWRGGPKVMLGPVGLPGEADLYFENLGNGTFQEAAAARGLGDAGKAYGFGVVATDYDDDGAVDLFVANDSKPNFLYRNRGDGSFESTALLAGAALSAEGRAQAGMGADAGDYDGDGLLDLIVTNFAHDTNTLRRNLGNRQFEDVTQAAGLAARTFVRMGWGAAFLDADLDGDLDLVFANGHIYPQVDEHPQLEESFAQANQLLLNEAGLFRDVSDAAGPGLAVRKSSRGLAAGDLDGDGDLDLVISNVDDVPTALEAQVVPGRHWIGFDVRREGRNRFAVGAKVVLEAGGRRQVREVRSGGGYLSQSDLRAQFGLGASEGPATVEVRLPGQGRWRFTGLAADRYHTLTLRDVDRLQPAK